MYLNITGKTTPFHKVAVIVSVKVAVAVWILSDIGHNFFPLVSEADSVVKVAEWQQTYYASDSGIQSGATTVRDDESSTEYSGRKKYSSSTTTSTATAPATATAGVGDSAASALESPTGETFFLAFRRSCCLVIWFSQFHYILPLPSFLYFNIPFFSLFINRYLFILEGFCWFCGFCNWRCLCANVFHLSIFWFIIYFFIWLPTGLSDTLLSQTPLNECWLDTFSLKEIVLLHDVIKIAVYPNTMQWYYI